MNSTRLVYLSVIIPNNIISSKLTSGDTTKPTRATRQRAAVLRAVEQVHTHPNVEEVYQIVRKKLPRISLGTVYRNLHLLSEEGKLREVQFLGDVIRYDAITGPHEHFYCRGCRKVWDLEPSLPKEMIQRVERKLKSSIERYALDYYGLCEKCQSKVH